MRKQLFRIWVSAAASGALALGGRSASGPAAYPEQPLLLSKTPVEGTIEMVETDQLAATEPAAPPAPAEALAAIPTPTAPTPSVFSMETSVTPSKEGPTTSEPP